MSNKILLSFLLVSAASVVSGRPYYFMFEQPASEASQTPQAIGQQVAAAGEQLQAQAQGQPGAPELPKRIQGHLSELYSHGSSAVRGVVDQVHPDLKNIGKDISEVYAATRDNVGRRIEPLAQTVRPFLDHAQKVVAPYVNSAREEVPKMIKQAGPVLEKVRDGVSGFVDKMKTGIQQAVQPGQQQQQQPLQQAQAQVQQVADSARSAVDNVIHTNQAPAAQPEPAAAAAPASA